MTIVDGDLKWYGHGHGHGHGGRRRFRLHTLRRCTYSNPVQGGRTSGGTGRSPAAMIGVRLQTFPRIPELARGPIVLPLVELEVIVIVVYLIPNRNTQDVERFIL